MTTHAKTIRIIAISGSLRPSSHTRAALRLVLSGAKESGAETQLVDLANYDLDFCAGTKAKESSKQDVLRLREEVRAAHGIILGTPEYHGSFSGVLKNALDLLDIEDFEGKVVGLVGISGGRTGAISALSGLRGVARALKAWVLPEEVSIAEAGKFFSTDGSIQDASLETRLVSFGKKATQFTALHASKESAVTALPVTVYVRTGEAHHA